MGELSQVGQHLRGDTGRLAATYLAIIMAMTVLFSGLIYAISTSQFDRPFSQRSDAIVPFDDSMRSSFERLLEHRAQQARADLFASLVLLNVAVLIAGGFISYILARKTLEPIEAAMQAQARFVSDASHELRTPLTALQVTNEVALRKKKLTLAEAKELIRHNLEETIKLRNLSEALLGLARQESADTSTRQVAIKEVVDSLVATITPLAAARQLRIVTAVDDTTLAANRTALAQVLAIFVDNAVKYAPESSRVTIASAQTNHELQVSVHDDGPAIPTRHQQKIFERFYRIDESRSSQHTQGSGLGLSIAQAVADRHGYRLSLSAAEHQGNTFILHIPTG